MDIPRPTWRVFLAGVLGGAVDAAPSISGATVYYVVGVYRYLLESITRAWDSFFAAVRTRSLAPILHERAWKYLLVLKSGVILSFLSFAHAILNCLQNAQIRPFLFSLFLGFVLGSAILCLQQVLSWTRTRTLLFALGITVGMLVVHAPPFFPETRCSVPVLTELPSVTNVDVSDSRLLDVPLSALKSIREKGALDLTRPVYDEATSLPIDICEESSSFLPFRPKIVLTGFIVASAMLLPGVSGSYVLNVLGCYSIVLSAILEVASGMVCMSFPLDAWELLLNLGAGVLLGLLLLSRVVLTLFKRHPCATQALLAGIMIGSIQCLWPFQKLISVIDPFHINQGPSLVSVGQYMPSLHESLSLWYVFPGCALAFAGVFFLQHLSASKLSAEEA